MYCTYLQGADPFHRYRDLSFTLLILLIYIFAPYGIWIVFSTVLLLHAVVVFFKFHYYFVPCFSMHKSPAGHAKLHVYHGQLVQSSRHGAL